MARKTLHEVACALTYDDIEDSLSIKIRETDAAAQRRGCEVSISLRVGLSAIAQGELIDLTLKRLRNTFLLGAISSDLRRGLLPLRDDLPTVVEIPKRWLEPDAIKDDLEALLRDIDKP